MRTLEAILLVTTLLAILGALLPRQRVRWRDFLPSLALVVALLHLLVEGSRWQMPPAYVLTGLVFLLKHIRTRARPEAPVAEGGAPYPVLLFSPGGRGLRVQNTFLVEELVSQGYVVAGIDHPHAVAATVYPPGLFRADRRASRAPTGQCLRAGFFDRTLRGRDAPLLEGPSVAYPEIQITVHEP